MYNSIQDAHTVLINSGVCELFQCEDLDNVAEYMYQNDKTPEQAAEFFGVA